MSKYDAPRNSWSEYRQLLSSFFPGKPTYTENEYPSLDGKVVVITGANTGVGYQTAKSLAASTNAKIYIFSRNEAKAVAAIKRIEEEVSSEYKKGQINAIEFIQVDLSDLTTVKPAVEKFLSSEKRLDIVIHNAGVFQPSWDGRKTTQGHELQLGTNSIGPHLLQKLLDPILIKTSASNKANETRVVWVSSTGQLSSPRGGFNFDDPNMESIRKPLLAYSQSKALNAIQARWWPKVHPEATGVVSVSLCPGLLDSELGREYGSIKRKAISMILHPVRMGAYTDLFAALSPEITTKNNGQHIVSFGKLGALRSDLEDDANNERIWSWLDEQVSSFV